ncbi:FLOURY 1-like-like protein [Drosera capensis]
MELSGHSYLFMEIHKRVLRFFVVLMFIDCSQTKATDFGCGCLSFCFSKIWDYLVLCFVFGLGYKTVQFRVHLRELSRRMSELGGKSRGLRGGFRLKGSAARAKMESNVIEKCVLEEKNGVLDSNGEVGHLKDDGFVYEDGDEEGMEDIDEDEIFDVIALRKLVKVQRRRVDAAQVELKKERMASASAADEAMAMIMRLQNEKSSLRIRVNELQRLAEEKQVHDHEVIQSLQWIIMKHESERSLLEDQLRLSREKLKVYEKSDEVDRFDCSRPTIDVSSSASRTDGRLISSLDFDSSPIYGSMFRTSLVGAKFIAVTDPETIQYIFQEEGKLFEMS